MALQWARAMRDDSPESRMMLAQAKKEYREAEASVLVVLGARAALALVEDLHAVCAEGPPSSDGFERVSKGGRSTSSQDGPLAHDGRGTDDPRWESPDAAARRPRGVGDVAAACG